MSSLVPALHHGSIAQVNDLTAYLEAAAGAGFRAADFNMSQARDLAKAESPEAVVEAFTSRGIQAGGWGSGVQVIVSNSEFASALADLEKSAELGALLNARTAAVLAPNRTHLPFDEAMDLFSVRVGEIADTMAGYGIAVSLEFIGPNLWPEQPHEFIAGISGTLELIDRIGRVNVGILFDTYHYHCGPNDLSDILSAGRTINHVHLNDAPPGDVLELDDSMRRLPGKGIIDLVEIAAALNVAGYTGPGGVEVFDDELRAVPALEGAKEIASACIDVFGTL